MGFVRRTPSTLSATRPIPWGRILLGLIPALMVAACSPIVGIGPLDVETEPAEPAPPDPEPSVVEDAGAPALEEPPIEEPADASDASAPDKRVFVTSTRASGVLNGTDGADSRCIAAADRAGIGGEWVAWVSTRGRNAIDRITHDGPYVRLDGARVVRNKKQLASGVLTAPINVTEAGTKAEGDALVWTGTSRNGLFSTDCKGWTSNFQFDYGALGYLDRSDGRWTDSGGPGFGFRNWWCPTSARLYCFEK